MKNLNELSNMSLINLWNQYIGEYSNDDERIIDGENGNGIEVIDFEELTEYVEGNEALIAEYNL